MKKLKIVIIEDIPDNAEYLKGCLRESPLLTDPEIRIFENIISAECHLQDQKTDLLFLDLDLNGQDGFEILRTVSAYCFRTIIVSGHVQKAIDAFEYGVLDFLPKPVEPERLNKALTAFSRGFLRFQTEPNIIVTTNKGQVVLQTSQIDYLEADAQKTKIFYSDQKIYETPKRLKYFEETLNDDFYRVQKSFLVNINSIAGLSTQSGGRYYIKTHRGQTLPVSRNMIDDLKKRITI